MWRAYGESDGYGNRRFPCRATRKSSVETKRRCVVNRRFYRLFSLFFSRLLNHRRKPRKNAHEEKRRRRRASATWLFKESDSKTQPDRPSSNEAGFAFVVSDA